MSSPQYGENLSRSLLWVSVPSVAYQQGTWRYPSEDQKLPDKGVRVFVFPHLVILWEASSSGAQ
jgi:hypothetical protein